MPNIHFRALVIGGGLGIALSTLAQPLLILEHPLSQDIREGDPVTFTVVVSGSPPYDYQWFKEGIPLPDRTNAVYALARAYRADAGAYQVLVNDTGGQPQMSLPAILNITWDTTPPTLVAAAGGPGLNTVAVTFSEPLSLVTATAVANYQIESEMGLGINVASAALAAPPGTPGDDQVILTTSAQSDRTTYTITVNNLRDVAGNIIATNSTVSFRSFAPNRAPSFTPGADPSVNEDAGPQTVFPWATAISPGPPDEANQTLEFLITDNTNPGLFAAGPAVARDGTLTFTPAPDAHGVAVFTLVLRDNGATAAVAPSPSIAWAGAGILQVEWMGEGTLEFTTALATVPWQAVVGAASPYTLYPTNTQWFGRLRQDPGQDPGQDTSEPRTFRIEVHPVNDAPSFQPGQSPVVLEDAGPQSIPGWAWAISPGPPNEADQTVAFLITGNTNPDLFAVGPAVAPDGTLTFTPAADAHGLADITLVLRDDGGTENGGVDASVEEAFRITVSPVPDEPRFHLEGEGFGNGVLSLPANFFHERILLAIPDLVPTNEASAVVTYSLDPAAVEFLHVRVDALQGQLTFTTVPQRTGSARFALTADDGEAQWTETFMVVVTPEISMAAAPLDYCLMPEPDQGTNLLFIVRPAGLGPFAYQWTVGGIPVPSLDHPALKLPLPGFPVPTTLPTTVQVEVMVTNPLGEVVTNASARLDSLEAPISLAFDPLVTVAPGEEAILTAEVIAAHGEDPWEYAWRFNGLRLSDRDDLIAGSGTNRLVLSHFQPGPPCDPTVSGCGYSQAGLYELIVGYAGCRYLARFEVEIGSDATPPHSVDHLEELQAVVEDFEREQAQRRPSLAAGPPIRLAAPPRPGMAIRTVPRTEYFQYLDVFASTHQEHEAELLHAGGRTNGFSRWFFLAPKDPPVNQLVTLSVAGSQDPGNTVLAVYAPITPSASLAITNLQLITRFDGFTDPTPSPAGGTNAVVSFETRSRPYFLVAVDTAESSGKVMLRWSADPFPEPDHFQWLKVKLPASCPYLQVELAGSTNEASPHGLYFAFAFPDAVYSKSVRVPTDWARWSDRIVTVGPAASNTVYLLMDPLFPGRYEVDLPTQATVELEGVRFTALPVAPAAQNPAGN